MCHFKDYARFGALPLACKPRDLGLLASRN
jgi:hypothetical protein